MPEKKEHRCIGGTKRSREIVRRTVVAADKKVPAVSRHLFQHPILTIATTFDCQHRIVILIDQLKCWGKARQVVHISSTLKCALKWGTSTSKVDAAVVQKSLMKSA